MGVVGACGGGMAAFVMADKRAIVESSWLVRRGRGASRYMSSE